MEQPRIMPNNKEAEQCLLGCILIDNNVALELTARHTPSDFYVNAHRTIFEAMTALVKANKNIDFITLTDMLDNAGKLDEVGGIPYVTELTRIVPSAANVMDYSELVRRDALRRSIIHTSQEIIKEAYENTDARSTLLSAEKMIFDINKREDRGDLVSIDGALGEALDRMEQITRDPQSMRGIMTGLPTFDQMTKGLQKSDLIILAASPGIGKTSLAMNIVAHAVTDERQKRIVAVFALEMSSVQLAQRMLCSVSGVSMQRATSGTLDRDTDFKKLWAAKKALTSAGEIYIDESMEANPNEIVAKCRRLKKDKGLDLVMIDYLQLMLGATTNGRSAESRQQEIGSITRTLKIMAMELKVPVLLLSQVNRAGAKRNSDEGGLQLFDLRDSGSIEQDADIVIFLSPQDRNETGSDKLVTLKIAKHRNGPQGEIPLRFSGETVSFRELTREERYVEEQKKNAQTKDSTNSSDNVSSDSNNSEVTEEVVPPMDDSMAPPEYSNIDNSYVDNGDIQY